MSRAFNRIGSRFHAGSILSKQPNFGIKFGTYTNFRSQVYNPLRHSNTKYLIPMGSRGMSDKKEIYTDEERKDNADMNRLLVFLGVIIVSVPVFSYWYDYWDEKKYILRKEREKRSDKDLADKNMADKVMERKLKSIREEKK